MKKVAPTNQSWYNCECMSLHSQLNAGVHDVIIHNHDCETVIRAVSELYIVTIIHI